MPQNLSSPATARKSPTGKLGTALAFAMTAMITAYQLQKSWDLEAANAKLFNENTRLAKIIVESVGPNSRSFDTRQNAMYQIGVLAQNKPMQALLSQAFSDCLKPYAKNAITLRVIGGSDLAADFSANRPGLHQLDEARSLARFSMNYAISVDGQLMGEIKYVPSLGIVYGLGDKTEIVQGFLTAAQYCAGNASSRIVEFTGNAEAYSIPAIPQKDPDLLRIPLGRPL